VGTDAASGRGLKTHHAQAFHESRTFPLAKSSGNHRHRHRETNRGCRPASLCTIIPGFQPPTGSLSTTAALALCVFVAVPLFGIEEKGMGGYLKSYVEPTVIMLPFNIISEVSRTLALAVRLFGNMMSGAMIIGILLSITPFIFPIVMTALGLLTGMVQAYIFFVLATVYIAAATRVRKGEPEAEAEPVY
jgi:F-type H+-transporting ATPase subunit a